MQQNFESMKPIVLVAALAAVSCTSYFEKRSENVDVEGTLSHDLIVLGDRLEDPYTVENMKRAVESLYPTRAGSLRMEATDLYVRFLPSGETDFEALEEMGLEMLDHPMDYEILKEGDYYHDPDIPEGEMTWQYAVVDAGFKFPEGVRCEIIDECYIAEHQPTKADDLDWDAVEREAYRLTGNGHLLGAVTKAGAVAPSGRIVVVDDVLGGEPQGVAGVKVTCNTFVKMGVAYTDADGYYQMERTYSSDMRYRIVFKNKKGFGIGFNLLLVPASVSTLGEQPAEGVSVQIDRNSERKLFCRAVVNNAAWDYFEACDDSTEKLRTPPANVRIWLLNSLGASSAVMMQQGCLVEDGLIGDFLGEYSPLVRMFLPDITIGLRDKESFSQIYFATQHELAHASHFAQVGREYWENVIRFVLTSYVTSGFVTYGVGTEENHGYCEVAEMWAYYLESKFYRERYSDTSVMFGTGYWFYPQILMFLDERGIGRSRIFSALTSDIVDSEGMRSKLISLYPESKGVINQAFERF